MSSLREHVSNPDFRALVQDRRMVLLDNYLAELEGIYNSQAVKQGDTDFAKGQFAAIKALRKDIENMKLDTNAETPKGDT